MTLKQITANLRRAGIDAYIERERIYFRDAEGGINAVYNRSQYDAIMQRRKAVPAFYVTLDVSNATT